MPVQFKLRSQPHFGRLTPETLRPFASSGMFWGIGAGIAVSLFMSPVPIFQKDVLDRFPIVRNFFIDDKHPADQPF